MSLHVKDGWHFARHPDGSVTVEKDGAALLAMSPAEWASVVASVSHGDEERGRFYVAHQFHMGGEVGCICPVAKHEPKCLLGIDS